MEEKVYSVSEAVRLVGVESHVLRYWEEELGILIQRNTLGHRIYSPDNIEIFQKVKEWKEKGLQLKAIRVLMEQIRGSQSAGTDDFEKQVQVITKREVADKWTAGAVDGAAEMQNTGTAASAAKMPGSRNTDEPEEEQMPDSGAGEPDNPEYLYEVIPADEQSQRDGMEKIASVFRQIVKEAAEEQNERLEQILERQIREEAQDLYLQYFQMLQEAAAARQDAVDVRAQQGKLRQIWNILFGDR